MNIKRAIGVAALVCLGLAFVVETPATAAESAPPKQTLAIPVTAAGKTLECLLDFGPAVPVAAVAFSPDGKMLASAGYREVLLWDLAGAKLFKRIGGDQLAGSARALVFLADGKSLAVGEGVPHQSGAVRIFDVESGRQTHVFDEPQEVVYALTLSPDGKHLVAGSADTSVYVWSVDDKKLVATLADHTGWVLGVSFSADGKQLATTGGDNSLRIWKTDTWQWAKSFGLKDVAHGAVFNTDGKTLNVAVGGPADRGLRTRRTDNDRYRRPMSTGGGMPLGLAFDPKTSKLFAPCSDKTIRVVDARNGRWLATLAGHQDWVYCATLNSDATRLASGSGDGTVKLWNTADGKLLATLVQMSPRTDGWLMLSVGGYLATSSADALRWNATNVKTPIEEITGVLQKPELLQKALAGEKTDPPALQ